VSNLGKAEMHISFVPEDAKEAKEVSECMCLNRKVRPRGNYDNECKRQATTAQKRKKIVLFSFLI
jgi:hypothetical protein